MAKTGLLLPSPFRISSRPISLFAACHSFLNPNQKPPHQFQILGFKQNLTQTIFSSFSTSTPNKSGEITSKPLPWLTASMERQRRKSVKNETTTNNKESVRSSWEDSADKFLKRASPTVEIRDTNNENDEDDDVDPRWHNIKKRYDTFVESKPERADVRRWNKQEEWGRKTWREAQESSLPKLYGECVYGVAPVLAAISAGRRVFHALFVQQGLDLSSNNKKKKDKKGFERVMKMAENIGLNIKEVSKHDLNMIVDNRPHQGLVLDASPLEMVGIKELEPVSEGAPLWLALDEITDPQNLGAIIRSAYFFGACGVVLCAKNSAPLSGVVSKASAGSLELMEIRSCKNMMRFLGSSAENGWRVLGGSVSSRAVPLSDVAAGGPTVLVLGSEGTGLRPLVERSCTQLIRIGGNLPVDLGTSDGDFDDHENHSRERSVLAVESLNVSVAAGVMLNHLIGGNSDDSGGIRESESA